MPSVYPRQRLFETLSSQLDSGHIWVEASPGSGKTTLINSYIETNSLACTWYRLDERDSELTNFFYYLSLLANRFSSVQAHKLPVLTPEYLLDIKAFARKYFEQFFQVLQLENAVGSDKHLLVVFDDYHRISSESPLHEVFEIALSEAPKDVRLLMISRTTLPLAFSSLRANRNLSVIDNDTLRFSPEETHAIVASILNQHDVQTISALITEQVRGWAAGIILLLEKYKNTGLADIAANKSFSPIHDYFLLTVFESLSDEVKDFLMKTAYLPVMTVGMAHQISDNNSAGIVLEKMHKDNFFTELRWGSEAVTYKYHDLFREFLLARSKAVYSSETLHEMQRAAGQILMASGYDEYAAIAFQNSNDWSSLGLLSMQRAQGLIEQGRFALLYQWLSLIPDDEIDGNPWLVYWLGCSQLCMNPMQALEKLELAYSLFSDNDDQVGQCLTFAAIVDVGVLSWNFGFLEPWIENVEQIIVDGVDFNSQEIETRVTMAMFTALIFTRPWYQLMTHWCDRLNRCIDECADPDAKIKLSYVLGLYYTWIDNFDGLRDLREKIRPIDNEDRSPLARIQWCLIDTTYAWFMSDFKYCCDRVDKIIALCKVSGVRVLDAQIYSSGVYGALSAGDLDRGGEYLRQMEAATPAHSVLIRAHLYGMKAWYDALKGRADACLDNINISMSLVEQDTSPFPVAYASNILSTYLIECDQLSQAEPLIAQAHSIGTKMHSSTVVIQSLFARARLLWRRGDTEAGNGSLSQAMVLMQKHSYKNLPIWDPAIMAKLCAKALDAGIETRYIQELIRERGLVPNISLGYLESWPWPIKIHTLGLVSITINDKPLMEEGKAQKMPLALLFTLISMGGQRVPVAKLSDILWPESDEEKMHNSFKTTVSRLRRLLGRNELLQLHDGCLSLDKRNCWVDIWAFENIFNAAVMGGQSTTKSLNIQSVEQAIGLYKGKFLADRNDENYEIVSTRERLQRNYINLIEQFAHHLIAIEQFGQAALILERGLKIDDLDEEVYRILMFCYAQMNRLPDALKLYEQCQHVLDQRLGIQPSLKTVTLYHNLKQRL